MRGTKLTNRGRLILCHPNPINAISLHLLVHNSIRLSPPQLALAQSAALFPAAMGVRPPPPYHAEERGMPPPQYLPPPPEPWFSWLVPLIFLANIAMFVLSMYVNDCPAKMNPERCLFYEYLGPFSFQPFNENPLLGPSAATLKGLGALERNLVVKKNEMWRLLSCMWFHAGVIHLAVNMMSLLFIGIRLEQEFGFLRIGILYVLSGFGGSLMSALASTGPKPTISVGASGALFGLLGAMLSELITNWSLYANKCAALVSLVFIICLNLAVGFLPHVDNSAHIGGFLSGILLGFILLFRPQYGYVSRRYIPAGYEVKHKKPKYKCYQHLFWAVSLVLLLLGYIIGLGRLFRGETIGQKHIGIFIHP